jgi:hypothetical protein
VQALGANINPRAARIRNCQTAGKPPGYPAVCKRCQDGIPFFNLCTIEKHQEQATKVALLLSALMNPGGTHQQLLLTQMAVS